MTNVRVESTATGYRVVALSAFRSGDVVLVMEGAEIDTPDRYTVQIGPELHLSPSRIPEGVHDAVGCEFMFTNHSCSPNIYIQNLSFIARMDIFPGDEITFDYETTEYEMAEPFQCHCGSVDCRGIIRGSRFLEKIPNNNFNQKTNPTHNSLSNLNLNSNPNPNRSLNSNPDKERESIA